MKSRLLLIAAVAALACGLTAGPASASQTFQLRVEAPGGTLDPGTHYALPSTVSAQRAALNNAGTCVDTGGRVPIAAGSALGLITAASQANSSLNPVLIAEDPFGRRVCRVGSFTETDAPFSGWLFRYNHVAPPLSAELVAIGPSDEILWNFADFGSGANTGDELVIDAPVRSTPGAVAVTVRAITFDGNIIPAPDGTVIQGGATPATTTGGAATVPVAEGETQLRAVGPGAAPTQIPSAALSVCVDSDLGDCPAKRGRRVIGTNEKDGLKGTGGPDTIRSRGAADKILVKGGDRDEVNCGRGKDVVIADSRDKLRRCETVRGLPEKKKGEKGK
jgi:hypothetical protein